MSKVTFSPPMSESKLTDASMPLRWKKCSLPSAASINPKPRSDTTFLMVPVDTVVSFALEQWMNVRSGSRERFLTTASACMRQASRDSTRTPLSRDRLWSPLLDVRTDLDQILQDFDWQASGRDLGRGVGRHLQRSQLTVIDVNALQAGIPPKLARRGLNEVRHTSAAVQLDPDRSYEMAYSLSPASRGGVPLAAPVVVHDVAPADELTVHPVENVTQ